MAPFVGATGNPTTLAETVFSTIPGSPVYASKASQYTQGRQPARHPERGPPGPQRPPGPLPLRGLTARSETTRCSRQPTSASRVATGRSSAGRSVALAVAAWLALWLWEGSPYGALPPSRRRRRAAAARGVALRRRLGADDRGDDAAVERPAGRDLRGARPAAAAARAGSSCCCSPATCWCGAPSGSAPGSRDRGIHAAVDAAAVARRAPAAHHRHDPRRRRPVAVQPAPGPLSRRVPQPARAS